MITIIDYSRPIWDQNDPTADPIYYIEYRVDGGCLQAGQIQCPEIPGSQQDRLVELTQRANLLEVRGSIVVIRG